MGPLTGFDYGTLPGAQARQLRDAQQVREYLDYLSQGGGFGEAYREYQADPRLFPEPSRRSTEAIQYNLGRMAGPLQQSAFVRNDNILGSALDLVNPLAKIGALGHTVYHGSPHRFDKFDISKIGTGEGAQAYGHGLYFAESPGVAKSYADPKSFAPFTQWRHKESPQYNFADDFWNKTEKESEIQEVFSRAAEDNTGIAEAIKNLLRDYDDWIKQDGGNALLEKKRGIVGNLRAEDFEAIDSPGYLYKADIPDEDIPKMLDWDAPYSGQSEQVKQALKIAGIEPPGITQRFRIEDQGGGDGFAIADKRRGEYLPVQFKTEGEARKQVEAIHARELEEFERQNTGLGLMQSLSEQFGAKGAAEQLHGLGIPGIKYYDQVSRTKGEGTRNYVTFSDEGLKILERE